MTARFPNIQGLHCPGEEEEGWNFMTGQEVERVAPGRPVMEKPHVKVSIEDHAQRLA